MKEKRPLKFALTGKGCSGKTTTKENLKIFYKDRTDIEFVDESARDYFRTHIVPERFSAQTQREIQDLTLHNEKKAHDKNPAIIITDTSILDQVVYTIAFGGTDKEAEEMFNRNLKWIKTYDIFLRMDSRDVIYQNDDIRTESAQDQEIVDKTLIKLFDAKNLNYKTVSGTPQERVDKIDKIISSYIPK